MTIFNFKNPIINLSLVYLLYALYDWSTIKEIAKFHVFCDTLFYIRRHIVKGCWSEAKDGEWRRGIQVESKIDKSNFVQLVFKFSNLYIFATWCGRYLTFQAIIPFRTNSKSKISKVNTFRLQRLENVNLRRVISSPFLIIYLDDLRLNGLDGTEYLRIRMRNISRSSSIISTRTFSS